MSERLPTKHMTYVIGEPLPISPEVHTDHGNIYFTISKNNGLTLVPEIILY